MEKNKYELFIQIYLYNIYTNYLYNNIKEILYKIKNWYKKI